MKLPSAGADSLPTDRETRMKSRSLPLTSSAILLRAALAAVLVLLGAVALAVAEHRQAQQRVRAQVISDVSDTRAKLEGALANRLALVDGVAALATALDGRVADQFDQFVVGLAGSHRSYTGRTGTDPALRSLQLAPGGVVTYVWPLAGNEAAVGHDLLADPVRGPAVRRAIDERRFVLAGPFELLQGGLGLVGRNPVYLPTPGGGEEFWGLATVVINFDEIAAEAGLAQTGRNGLTYAVRGTDGLGADGDVFLGAEDVFAGDPVILDVLVPNGTWQVAAHPADGWPVLHRRLIPLAVILIGAVVALALGGAVWRDVTGQVEATRIRAENVAIARSARLKDEFVAGMSHELRTPLNAIIGLSRVLERATFGPLNEKQFEYIQQIGSSGEHLLALINQVLDLAKIEANSDHLELTDVDLMEAATEALHVVRPLATKKRLELVGPVGGGNVTVTADPLKVRQILLNLLSNAVKFTPDGGMVGVEIDATPTSAGITVWDTGIGIGEDEHHLLFEPFQQLDGSLAREHEGTGLGLAMVQKLAELHGGSVSVESRLGHGARFVVSIPRTAGVQRTGDLKAAV